MEKLVRDGNVELRQLVEHASKEGSHDIRSSAMEMRLLRDGKSTGRGCVLAPYGNYPFRRD
jgi:hypothetical protein